MKKIILLLALFLGMSCVYSQPLENTSKETIDSISTSPQEPATQSEQPETKEQKISTENTQAEVQKQESPKKEHRKPEKRFRFAARGGVSSSSLSSSPTNYSSNPQVGFNIGMQFRVFIFKNLYVQPELNYFFSSYKFTRISDDLEDKVKIHTLTIPVLLGYTLIDKPGFGFRAQTGPSISINLSVSENDIGITDDDFKNVYASWLLDGQIRVKKISVQGGYSFGMTNYAFGERSHSWYVGAGVSF